METGKRGYFLADDPLYLQIYREADDTLQREKPKEQLIKATADNPIQQAKAKAMRAAFDRWRADAGREIGVWQRTPSARLPLRFQDLLGKQGMD